MFSHSIRMAAGYLTYGGDAYTPTYGALWGWGENVDGQLGDNTITPKSSPIQTVAGGTNWKQISVGSFHTAGIKQDGTLWLWGEGDFGQLGDGTSVGKSSPVQTVAGGTDWVNVSCGHRFTMATKSDGTLWLWGDNTYGQLGDNTITPKSSPIQTVAGGTNWSVLGASDAGGVASAIKTDGTLWLWGYNLTGVLGDNTTTHKSSPIQTVAGGTNWSTISAVLHAAAVKTDGTLWTWGSGTVGKLGDNTTTNKSSPVQTISGGTNWVRAEVSIFHTVAVKTDGTLWTWGGNNNGGLGDNSTTAKSSPVQTVSGGTTWSTDPFAITAGRYTSGAVKTDGTLWTWGWNSAGQLGDNTTANRSSPIQTVAGGTNWSSVSCGYSHMVATTALA